MAPCCPPPLAVHDGRLPIDRARRRLCPCYPDSDRIAGRERVRERQIEQGVESGCSALPLSAPSALRRDAVSFRSGWHRTHVGTGSRSLNIAHAIVFEGGDFGVRP